MSGIFNPIVLSPLLLILQSLKLEETPCGAYEEIPRREKVDVEGRLNTVKSKNNVILL